MSKQSGMPCRCCSCRHRIVSRSPSSSNNRDVIPEEKNDCLKESSSRNIRSTLSNLAANADLELDKEEMGELSEAVDNWFLSVLRRQAQQAAKSETDYTSSTDARFDIDRPNINSGVLRNARDALDYAPESEFLRNMRLQCKYLQNCQPNVFSAVDKFYQDPSTRECQYKCVDAPNPVLERREEVDNALKSSSCRHFQFNPQLVNHEKISQNPPRPCTCSRGCQAGEGLEESPQNASERQSEHISRSRKQVIRCRGRRKRKSKSSERCESENEFQASLKKPHENSCERCWRYASPARSPVNKPDQRFDPNFRRGHSCVNLPNRDEDLQDFEESPCIHHHVTCCRRRKETPSPTTQRPQSKTNLERHPHKSQVKVSVEQQPQRSQVRSGSEQKSQVGISFAMPLQKPQVRLERPCLNSQTGNDFQQPSQRSPAVYTRDVPYSTRTKVQGTARQRSQSPGSTQQSPTALPHSFTQVKELKHPSESRLQFDRKNLRAKTFENIEALKSKLPTSSRLLFSDPGCRPRPKSYTPGTSVDNARSIADLKSKDILKMSSTSRRLSFEPTNATARSLRSPDQRVSPRAGENFSDSSKSPCRCEQCGLYKLSPNPEARANLNLTPQLGSLKESNKSPPKAASAGARVSPGKNMRSSSPKRPATGTSKRGKSKTPSPKPKQEVRKSPKRTPQKSKSPKASPNKSKSPKSSPCKKESPKPGPSGIKSQHAVLKEVYSPGNNKSHSGDLQSTQSPSSNCEKMLEAFLKASHPVKECSCYPRVSGLRRSYEEGHILCCHCKCGANQSSNNPLEVFSTAQAMSEIEQLANVSDETVYADICINSNNKSPTSGPCNDRPDTQRYASPENNRVQEHNIECPYSRLAHSVTSPPSLTQNLAANYSPTMRENRMQVPKNGFASSEPRPKECSPRKYFVFYTTKCKENRSKDDVEVLVEELARGYPYAQDSRTTDITEKMKKILDCPSDSMALRFQKGVSETCRAPRSSRILYF